ncbi:hypothetical protein ACFORO_25995 [Amycolatopsis halotolerans]|uniref:Magnesium transporter MgtE intracellular domain-containing protein n=1 Tax=Amycolatopsis halotolerans TaxID=330083 RepID=A0ABV7QKE5_9PSEU
MNQALTAFAEAFTAEDTVRELAPTMASGEAGAIADLLDALGENTAASLWRELADNDSESDR